MYSLSPSITSVEDILLSAIAEGLSPWVPVAIAMLHQFAVGALRSAASAMNSWTAPTSIQNCVKEGAS